MIWGTVVCISRYKGVYLEMPERKETCPRNDGPLTGTICYFKGDSHGAGFGLFPSSPSLFCSRLHLCSAVCFLHSLLCQGTCPLCRRNHLQMPFVMNTLRGFEPLPGRDGEKGACVSGSLGLLRQVAVLQALPSMWPPVDGMMAIWGMNVSKDSPS